MEETRDIEKLEIHVMSWLYLVANYGRLIDKNNVGIYWVEKTNDINKLDIDQLIGFLDTTKTRIDWSTNVVGLQSGGDERHWKAGNWLADWLYLVASYGRLIEWVEKTNDINKLDIDELIGFSCN